MDILGAHALNENKVFSSHGPQLFMAAGPRDWHSGRLVFFVNILVLCATNIHNNYRRQKLAIFSSCGNMSGFVCVAFFPFKAVKKTKSAAHSLGF